MPYKNSEDRKVQQARYRVEKCEQVQGWKRSYKARHRARVLEQARVYARNRRIKNPQWAKKNDRARRARVLARNPKFDRDENLRKLYKMSGQEFDALLVLQENKCLICKEPGKPGPRNGLYVDHNHDTGKIRALLCKNCNAGLGQFKDRADLLRAAADYLDNFLPSAVIEDDISYCYQDSFPVSVQFS